MPQPARRTKIRKLRSGDARVSFNQVVEPPTYEQRETQLKGNQVMKYLAGEPDARDESVDPPMQNRKLPPAQEKIEKESAAEEVSFTVSYEEERNQSEKNNRGSDINIGSAPGVREQERDRIFRRQVPCVPEHRIWNSLAPPNRVSFSDPPINLARPLYGREPLNRRQTAPQPALHLPAPGEGRSGHSTAIASNLEKV